MSKRYAPPPLPIFQDRQRWFRQAQEHADDSSKPAPNPALLVSGLRADDAERWEIGASDARILFDIEGPTAIGLTFGKPDARRNPNEANDAEWFFDEAGVLLAQMHVLYGGLVGATWSESAAGERIFHYLKITGLPGSKAIFRFGRQLANTPPGSLTKFATSSTLSAVLGPSFKPFRDMRRCSLPYKQQTQAQAVRRHGPGGVNWRKSITRDDLIAASLRAFDENHATSGLPLSRSEYAAILREAYALLDLTPLKAVAR
jgi:hypothetical protein